MNLAIPDHVVLPAASEGRKRVVWGEGEGGGTWPTSTRVADAPRAHSLIRHMRQNNVDEAHHEPGNPRPRGVASGVGSMLCSAPACSRRRPNVADEYTRSRRTTRS